VVTNPYPLERLTKVVGIGPWSAHMHLIFSLGRLDVWPTGDLGVRLGLQKFRRDAAPPSPRSADLLGDAFRPYRTLLAWYMWRVHDVESWR
jgi:3-methyladenine DNA glycosylase/8-oxoguanine DNA glycosylase